MRNKKNNVLYYPDFFSSETTLKKAILFFDEIHFMDRPSFSFENFGSIGAPSPLRQYEQSFRNNGVPLFVHGIDGGQVKGGLLEQIKADINDIAFLNSFQTGLISSSTFRNLIIQPGGYGTIGNALDVFNKVAQVDIASISSIEGTAENLLLDKSIKPFELTSLIGCRKQLIIMAAICSAKINFALQESARNQFIPLADAKPFIDLLTTRYMRATNHLPKDNKMQIADLSFAIFDELVSNECIEKMTIKDVVKYRKISEKAREEFLEYLSELQVKQSVLQNNLEYEKSINHLVKTEIIPAAKNFKDKLQMANENFVGTLAKGAVTGLGASTSVATIFPDLSWGHILSLGLSAAVFTAKSAIDSILEKRAIQREQSISYVLSLDN
ncbi:MAG: hypothetical protein ACK4PR_05820 [Gammaproteobacteria bacterium]